MYVEHDFSESFLFLYPFIASLLSLGLSVHPSFHPSIHLFSFLSYSPPFVTEYSRMGYFDIISFWELKPQDALEDTEKKRPPFLYPHSEWWKCWVTSQSQRRMNLWPSLPSGSQNNCLALSCSLSHHEVDLEHTRFVPTKELSMQFW